MDGQKRFESIDVLRGLSILAVILLHIRIRMSITGHPITAGLPPWLSHLVFFNGANGVTVFFAVSGFLITCTSLARFGSLAGMRPAVFYRYRLARIAPLLALTLAILSGLHLLGVKDFTIDPAKTTLARALLAAVTFQVNWLEAKVGYLPANWDVLWSLSIEEMFYLFFPLACLGVRRLPRGTLAFAALLAVFAAIGPVVRTVGGGNDIWQEKSYLGNMDAIALGCLAALATRALGRDPRAARRPVVLTLQICGAALMLLVVLWPQWAWLRALGRLGLDTTILPLGTGLFMIGAVLGGSLGGYTGRMWSRPLRWFGRHSYEIYLTHEFVAIWGVTLYAAWGGSPAVWGTAIIVLSGGLGALVARYVSDPANARLRGAAREQQVFMTSGQGLAAAPAGGNAAPQQN